MNKKEYASAIIRSKDGELILQLRDDNPAIVDPNCLSLFAEEIKEGESRDEALRRGIKEEIELDADEVEYLYSYELEDEKNNTMRVSHVFFIDNVDPAAITVHEGQGYRTIRTSEDLERFQFAQISKNILAQWFTPSGTESLNK